MNSISNLATDNVVRAIAFAAKAHAGQTRKYAALGEQPDPFINHPIRVMRRLSNYFITSETYQSQDNESTLLMVAVLHDTVEDTKTTLAEIRQNFGSGVEDGVRWLTKIDSSAPRDVRRKHECERLSKAPTKIKIIKMFDRIDNLRDMRFAPYDFTINKFVPESLQLGTFIGDADQSVYEELLSAIDWIQSVMIGTDK
jgi:guanosine-3',5'-bis(diphosphate) 3'-pyrophosphohydrolase